MIFKKFKSNREVNVNIRKYIIDWDSSPSNEQKILQDFLYPYFKNKVILAEFRIPGSLLRFDIVNISNRYIIEYSPDSTHFEFNPYFHGSRPSGYLKRIKTDMEKITWAEQNGFRVIELNKEDLGHLSRDYFLDKFQILL